MAKSWSLFRFYITLVKGKEKQDRKRNAKIFAYRSQYRDIRLFDIVLNLWQICLGDVAFFGQYILSDAFLLSEIFYGCAKIHVINIWENLGVSSEDVFEVLSSEEQPAKNVKYFDNCANITILLCLLNQSQAIIQKCFFFVRKRTTVLQ